MNKKSEAKLNMFRAVLKHCQDNETIIATIPALQNAVASLSTKVSAILSLAQTDSEVITGIATDKTVKKNLLINLTVSTAAGIFAYAVFKKDSALMANAKLSQSDLLKLRDDILGPRCRSIWQLATDNNKDLADYGITQSTLDAFDKAITDYTSVVPAPRNAKAGKFAVSKAISNIINETTAHLSSQVDKLALALKDSQKDFYNSYLSNRIIVDAAKTPTQIKGNVTDAVKNQPVSNAQVLLSGKVKAVTNTKGNFTFKPLETGSYSVQVTKEGFKEYNLNGIETKQGKITKLKIQLQQ